MTFTTPLQDLANLILLIRILALTVQPHHRSTLPMQVLVVLLLLPLLHLQDYTSSLQAIKHLPTQLRLPTMCPAHSDVLHSPHITDPVVQKVTLVDIHRQIRHPQDRNQLVTWLHHPSHPKSSTHPQHHKTSILITTKVIG